MEMEKKPPLTLAFLCKMLQRIEESPTSNLKKKNALQRLLEAARAAGDLYGVVRLLIPQRDLERRNYNIKEAALASCLVFAFGIAPKSVDGKLLFDWKRATNPAVGDFPSIASQVMAKRQHGPCVDLSIPELNSLLDRIAMSSTREEKGQVLRELISKITAGEMKWVLRFLLKDVRIGLGENSVLDEIHPDARDMMASCVDLRNVCVHLFNRNIQYLRQELLVGKPVKCQHSKRMCSVDATWDHMKGKEITAECKFDGDRMQVHKDETCVQFWSRNGKEHDEYKSALGEVLHRCILSTRCILDGELLVWDSLEKRFKQRTNTLNRHAAAAARKGFETTEKVCYVIFDILYEEKHGSVIHLPLKERRNILKNIVQPLFPQVIHIGEGNNRWSTLPTSKEELADFFARTVQHGDEGIIVKDLCSQWCPDNRDGRWCKIKPDYISMGNDLDLLIIGGYYGKCQYGGQIVSYLLALVDDSEGKSHSLRFISICRCGIGLSEEDRSLLQSKLAPFLLVNNKRGRPPSGCKYLVTNSRYECPDVWVSKPEMSVVVQVSSEKRVYPTSTFKAGWTFRFPRIVRVRYDKCWSEPLQLREFEEMIQIARLNGNSLFYCHKYDPIIKVSKRRKREQLQRNSVVLLHFQSSIIAPGEEAHGHLDNMVFYICNLTTDINKAKLFAQIQECGGKIAMNLSQFVTHVIAAEPKGLQYKVAKSSEFDVIHISWLFSMLESKGILPILPRHYLYLSNKTTKTINESVDEFGDPWFAPLEREDLFQIFQNMDSWCYSSATSVTGKRVSLKLGRPWLSGIFHSCCIYFHKPIHSRNPDSQSIAMISLRRLQLEAELQGSSISRNLATDTTHMVVYVPDGVKLSFKTILHSLSELQRQLVCTSNINIIRHAWIEECIIFGKRLESELYNLRSDEELQCVLASNCFEVKSGLHSIFEKTVIKSNVGNSSVTENQSSSNIPSDMGNRLGFDNQRPSSNDKTNLESFTAGACSEQKIHHSPAHHYDLSELKGIDNVGHSFELYKDSADVVENMSQILLGVPSNFY